MKVQIWAIGKTSFSYLQEGISLYEARLRHYLPFSFEIIPDVKRGKNTSPELLKRAEGEAVLQKLQASDYLILLDEKGKEMDSLSLSSWLERKLSGGHRRIIFLVGGAYGFSDELYARANYKLSLSQLTYSHQMVRLFMIEQLYRCMTILKGEPYHHS